MPARLHKLFATKGLHYFGAALLVTSIAMLGGCAGVTSNAKDGGGSGSGSGGSGSLAVSTATLPGGTVGTAYSATLQASGGTTPYAWSVSSGTLPAGLSLNATSGAISGTPTSSGTSTFTIQVADANSGTATKSLSIAVAAAGQTLSVSTTSLAAGTVGTAYSATLQASGGTTPYSWGVSSGSLPAGLTLNASSGAISGTPTASGSSNFTVQVKDANSATATKSLSISVSAAAQALAITTTSVPDGSTNTAYSAFLYAAGGKTPYTWSISSGSLPAGLTLSSTGDITGVPTATGTFSFTAEVTDSSSTKQTATANFSMTVAQGTSHSVALTWTASPTSGVAGYNVYRSTVDGSGFVQINTSLVTSLTYTDGTVLDSTTYYWVVTAVDGSGNESAYSPEFSLAIP
ncbi:MAG TPA: putative Ig domain-containing protein [Candidatus Acidoferrales bacterium]|nr:putative Ig domain-containing protein [Candidatus Acidoferrales bacterium]